MTLQAAGTARAKALHRRVPWGPRKVRRPVCLGLSR